MTGSQGHDGDGWVECAAGHRHWGRYGAAGLLVHRCLADGALEVLLQHRAEWSHFGGTWGLLGGARSSRESAVAGALREAAEEGAVDPSMLRVDARFDDDHGGWSYQTVVAEAAPDLRARASGGESIDVAWHPAADLGSLALHPGFAATWPALGAALAPLTVVLDVANVMGSRPDGWWKDRQGAARRLVERSASVAQAGLADGRLPEGLPRPPMHHWWPRVTAVVEGAARPAGDRPPAGVGVVAAPGSGDDSIVEAASGLPGPVVVVTADRELRRRCAEVGAAAAGPRWWLGLLDDAEA